MPPQPQQTPQESANLSRQIYYQGTSVSPLKKEEAGQKLPTNPFMLLLQTNWRIRILFLVVLTIVCIGLSYFTTRELLRPLPHIPKDTELINEKGVPPHLKHPIPASGQFSGY